MPKHPARGSPSLIKGPRANPPFFSFHEIATSWKLQAKDEIATSIRYAHTLMYKIF